MNVIEFALLTAAGSYLAGFLGAMTGLGGGVIIVPMLTLLFGVDIHYAIGASLISVIATSSGAAAAFVKEGFTNIRIGMFLEIATTCGALVGASLAMKLNPNIIAFIFGIVLLYSAYLALSPCVGCEGEEHPDHLATRLRMGGTYPSGEKIISYRVRRVPQGFGLMFIAGSLSGLLGIGSGAVKVLAMDKVMRVPFKVSTTTSNFMIGVTAAASAGVYLHSGFIDPGVTMPVMLGVLLGSMTGARALAVYPAGRLRIVFALLIAIMALEMIYNAIAGKI
jgi:uncharacterized protein